ncbi:MAG TPA: glucose-1-phosphate cytidylyltransferase [Tepidisphaeraceae bacterium]|nr:glucose-1-phosphate cytidylyltransferase [Tepidisphaeraceae bacterium]
MKVVILAGGMGTRFPEETDVKPKPMVEIGGKPILWHIMQHYSGYGFNEFVICLGYRGESVKRFMMEFAKLNSNMTVKLRSGDIMRHGEGAQCHWTVDLVDTGVNTETGGRIKRVREYIGNAPFMMTYGDGVCDVNLTELLAFHKKQGKLATLTAVHPPARFGHMHIDGELITKFSEKSQVEAGWINGGFFVLEPKIFDYIDGDETWFERDVLDKLASEKQLTAFKHGNFWQCMDTLRDKRLLEELWDSGKAPWKVS